MLKEIIATALLTTCTSNSAILTTPKRAIETTEYNLSDNKKIVDEITTNIPSQYGIVWQEAVKETINLTNEYFNLEGYIYRSHTYIQTDRQITFETKDYLYMFFKITEYVYMSETLNYDLYIYTQREPSTQLQNEKGIYYTQNSITWNAWQQYYDNIAYGNMFNEESYEIIRNAISQNDPQETQYEVSTAEEYEETKTIETPNEEGQRRTQPIYYACAVKIVNTISNPNTEMPQNYITHLTLENIELEINRNTDPQNPTIITEVVDIPGLMFTILGMPFTWLSTAFNLTIFSGTPYAVNISNLLLAILGVLIFIFLLKLFIRK